MAIYQTKQQTDLEKRLQLLRRQVYGNSKEKLSAPVANTLASSNSSASTDLVYLHKDLFKILCFSSLAVGFQLLLFILMQKSIVNINFL